MTATIRAWAKMILRIWAARGGDDAQQAELEGLLEDADHQRVDDAERGDEQAEDDHAPEAGVDARHHRVDFALEFGERLQDEAVALGDLQQLAADVVEFRVVGLHDEDVDAADFELLLGDGAVHVDGEAAGLVVVDDGGDAERLDAGVGFERQFVADA